MTKDDIINIIMGFLENFKEDESQNDFDFCTLPEVGEIKKILVFYIDIGQLPMSRVGNLLNNYKISFDKLVDKLGIGLIILPVRNRITSIEVVNL